MARRPMARSRKRTVRQSILAVVTVAFAVFAWSFGSFVIKDNGDTRAQRSVSWFRNHKLGPIVDVAERLRYGHAPANKAATSLGLAPDATAAPTTASTEATITTTAAPTTTTTIVSATTVSPASAPPTTAATTTSTTAATTTTTTVPAWTIAPANINPPVQPPLPDEGIWKPLANAGATPAMWATSVRPLPDSPAVVGSFAIIDQTWLTAAMFNGSDIPGGTDWRLGNRVPKELQPMLVGAFNGGFRFEHIKGGYKTEDKVVRELKVGQGTIAVSKLGKITLGEFGRDFTDDGSWASFRHEGKSMVESHGETWWGADFGNVLFVLRSSICQLPDGRLMYGAVGKVDAKTLAASLVNMGCKRALQLDINGTWPTFHTFPVEADGLQHGNALDKRMGGSRDRYLTGSSREFFGFFNTSALPPNSVIQPAPPA
jgi:hypothetical protein